MERYNRISSMEDDVRTIGSHIRLLPAVSLVVAAFSFMLTTVVWRLVHQTSAVEAAVHESIVEINRLTTSTSGDLAQVQGGLAGQTVVLDQLERRLAKMESASLVGIDRIQALSSDMARQWVAADQVRQELQRATTSLSQMRQQILEQMAVDNNQQTESRDVMVRQVNAAMTQMERALLAQTEDFQQQKQKFDAAADRDRATRRAMLHEATQAFTVQVEGLRQILDGLRIEANAVEDAALPPEATTVAASPQAAEAPATTQATVIQVPSPVIDELAPAATDEVSDLGPDEPAESSEPGQPTTAALETDTVRE